MQLVAAALATRSDHEIRVAGFDRSHQFRDVERIVRAVGVDEDEDAGRGLIDRDPQRLTLAVTVIGDDARAVLGRDRGGPVARMAVDHEHFVRERLHRVDDFADQPFLILGRDNNGDTGVAHRLEQLGGRAVVTEVPV